MSGRIVVLLGATASGKSDVAVGLAQAVGGEIINADSMQIYRQLDAGTAKPTPQQRGAVAHHLVDVVEPTDRFTVADWLEQAEAKITELHARGRRAIVVGGTNLYIKALLEGMFEGPPADAAFRRETADLPAAELHRRLAQVDPDAAARIHPNDHKRLVRALEVQHVTGRPISDWQREWQDDASMRAYRHDPILIGLHWPTEALNRRINQRVKHMFEPAGGAEDLIAETRRLEAAGLLGEQARQAIGTRQVLEHLAGRWSEQEAFEQVKIETRRFAKAQRTWLKRYRGVHWLDASALDREALIERAAACVRAALHDSPAGNGAEPSK